jgi:hypothetical protein
MVGQSEVILAAGLIPILCRLLIERRILMK